MTVVMTVTIQSKTVYDKACGDERVAEEDLRKNTKPEKNEKLQQAVQKKNQYKREMEVEYRGVIEKTNDFVKSIYTERLPKLLEVKSCN